LAPLNINVDDVKAKDYGGVATNVMNGLAAASSFNLKNSTEALTSDPYKSALSDYTKSLSENKQNIASAMGLSDDEYNHLAQLASGIAQQESRYGMSMKYMAKQALGELGNKAYN